MTWLQLGIISILLEISDFHIVVNLSIVVHALPMHMSDVTFSRGDIAIKKQDM